jgi:hypothetical protein
MMAQAEIDAKILNDEVADPDKKEEDKGKRGL